MFCLNFTGLNFGNVNTAISFSLPVSTCLIFMAGTFIVYLAIALYLQQVLPSKYGVPRKWWFIFDPAFYCGGSKKKRKSVLKDKPEVCVGLLWLFIL